MVSGSIIVDLQLLPSTSAFTAGRSASQVLDALQKQTRDPASKLLNGRETKSLIFLSPFPPRTTAGKDAPVHPLSELPTRALIPTTGKNQKGKALTGRAPEMEKQRTRDPEHGKDREQSKINSHGGDVPKKTFVSGPEGIVPSSVKTKLPPSKDASQSILEDDVVGESARRQQVSSFINDCRIVASFWYNFRSLRAFLMCLMCAGGIASANAPKTAWPRAREKRGPATAAGGVFAAE